MNFDGEGGRGLISITTSKIYCIAIVLQLCFPRIRSHRGLFEGGLFGNLGLFEDLRYIELNCYDGSDRTDKHRCMWHFFSTLVSCY